MKQLPKGYIAVAADYENSPKNTFTYKDETYAVVEGENLFANIADALAEANDVPQTVIAGLPYNHFDTPVILFSKGEHLFDKTIITKSVTILGVGAGIDPNIPGVLREDVPELNPLRTAENESLMYGSYWFGKVRITDPAATTVIVDGFSSRGVSFYDMRSTGEECYVSCRNIIHLSPCPRTLYYFEDAKADSMLSRMIELKNIRVVDFDDYDYGTFFSLTNARQAIFDGICYVNAAPTFGFSDFAGHKANCPLNTDRANYLIRNCYFKNLTGYRPIGTISRTAGSRVINLTVSNSVFIDAGRNGSSALCAYLPNNESILSVTNCVFRDTRGNAQTAIEIKGEGKKTVIENCSFTGFNGEIGFRPAVQLAADSKIENHAENYISATTDPHIIIGSNYADFTALDRLYEGTKPYYGDLHVHTACGGTSDGKTPMAEWPQKMDEKKLDFVAVVDHRQMRGFFLPEWDDKRFIIGTEPGTQITEGLNSVRLNQNKVHYNMLFPHKYGLAMVLANFTEFGFHGDELTGSFSLPHFTKERLMELASFVRSIGGVFVHPHPKSMLYSTDPLDYYLGEHTFIETLYESPTSSETFKNYELWQKLLAAGKRVYASCGSDTHNEVSNSAVATFYTKDKNGRTFFDKMRTADFAVGGIGIKMCIDGHPMGSEVEYHDGMKLTLRIDDWFEPTWRSDSVLRLRVITERGIAYETTYSGKLPQELSLEVKKRAFYRVEIFDVSNEVLVAHGNPIWLD